MRYARLVDRPSTYVKGATDGQKHRVPCIACSNVTLHTVQGSITENEPAIAVDTGEDLGTFDTDYELVQCDGCESVSFRTFWTTSNEDPEYAAVPDDRARYFPPRLEGRRRLAGVKLPPNIKLIYEETHASLCAGSAILTGIGMRAIVEGLCRKKGARTGSLEQKIDKLVTLAVLSRDAAKALHRLRDLGNLAAHEVKALNSTTLNVAMNVVEQLLTQVYYTEGEEVKKHLPRKRKMRPKPKAPPKS